MTLQSSVVIFQALELLQPQWPWQPQQPQRPQWPWRPHFIKKNTDPDGWIIPSTQWSKPVPFCGMDHQKSNFLLISGTLSLGGCWGQLMLLFWKLVDKTEMSKPPEHTRHHDSRQLSILLPLRAIYFSTFQYEISYHLETESAYNCTNSDTV